MPGYNVPEGDDWSFRQAIEEITGITRWYDYCQRDVSKLNWRTVPVATRLSWLAGRRTTRVEDMAYCLLGLLDVNMPLLYGEGHKAFLRLQEEFLKKHYDPTIVLWGFGMNNFEISNIEKKFGLDGLARTPLLFRGFKDVPLALNYRPAGGIWRPSWTVIPDGLNMSLPILQFDARHNVYIGVVDSIDPGGRGYPSIPLRRHQASDSYGRIPNCRPLFLRISNAWFKHRNLKQRTLRLTSQEFQPIRPPRQYAVLTIDIVELFQKGFDIDSVYPPIPVKYQCATLVMDRAPSLQQKHYVLVLNRERRDTLYLRLTFQIRKPGDRGLGCTMLLCSCPYFERRSAMEVWDAGRKPWRRCFLDPPKLNWHKSVEIPVSLGVEQFYSTFSKIAGSHLGWECTIGVWGRGYQPKLNWLSDGH
ncbi:hypothetical protein O1611_g10177 [Lasiodiplodia mahajangana]|uniref:Uncharacterized protein n=1 Tax=Lasiodiplodia mahajangana TaxID=1108764 RepID=A0ACC2J196_9PEZI|nr:hypothetical protein O1611_g10177 [Lasiodiplodia mahajangana]